MLHSYGSSLKLWTSLGICETLGGLEINRAMGKTSVHGSMTKPEGQSNKQIINIDVLKNPFRNAVAFVICPKLEFEGFDRRKGESPFYIVFRLQDAPHLNLRPTLGCLRKPVERMVA